MIAIAFILLSFAILSSLLTNLAIVTVFIGVVFTFLSWIRDLRWS